jgi:protein MAK11
LPAHLQIITGTYEKTLHGFVASIHPLPASSTTAPDSISLSTTFNDTFLFTAHTSPLRALAISPVAPNTTKRTLVTSSADERINLYTLSTILPVNPTASSLTGRNRHLGTLHNHHNTPTTLLFTPTRTKLLTAGADGLIHILRTRDWSTLTTLRTPKPKVKPINFAANYEEGYGPRIQTFTDPSEVSGSPINDLALHPSQKILLSVSAGERAVRMWNLMTGRKVGVLVFDREAVPPVFGGEALRVEWSADGEDYAVAFERGVVVFGMDSRPRRRIVPPTVTRVRTKVHMLRYLSLPRSVLGMEEVLAVSTEDGRVLFYNTRVEGETEEAQLLGAVGGRSLGMPTRVKDFVTVVPANQERVFLVTACSDGVVRVWDLCGSGNVEIEVAEAETEAKKVKVDPAKDNDTAAAERQVGRLVGVYETGRRITCLAGMLMREGAEKEEEEEEEDDSNDEEEEESD